MLMKASQREIAASAANWRKKIVRQFADGWVESDNPRKSADKTVVKQSNIIASQYVNFVKSSTQEALPQHEEISDPGLPKRDIDRLNNVIGYMYNEDKISLKLTFEQAGLLLKTSYDEEERAFRYLIGDREICRAEGDLNEAHTKARDRLVQIIRYYCYTVKRIKPFHTRRGVLRKLPGKQAEKQTFSNHQLDEDNIGFRMLQKQGWTGGSLGSNEDGILEPIGLKKKSNKAGLGAEDSRPEKIPVEAFMLVIKQYAAGNALYDLVFSPHFSKHQVIKLKDFASTLKLFPQFVGKKKQLVISKNLSLRDIKIGVLKGHSDLCAKYAVIPPISR
ncbi:uncharacterized protein LOC128738175 [Sabethes cyaneus]|uniref:uncharacterized protein LOC128738175 n=1 Tax=Sabethes cyaneus TaxID=53552 RepID=UPI00237D5E4A|nr:uncharacterized protein LOC128738175 [Sabethes cyaneus]